MSRQPTQSRTATLISYLDAQRRHVLGALDGLDEAALRRPVLPTGWSCLGLVRHLALDVERFWFRAVIAGEHEVIGGLTHDAWQVGDDIAVDEVLELYRQAIDRANAIISSTPLDTPPAWWPEEQFGDWRLDDLYEVILHVLTETATHAGHLDAARELIDGKTWLILTS